MANSLVHQVEVTDRRTVDTAETLRAALDDLLGPDDANLAQTYVLELVAEILSDGSVCEELRIREAEPA